MTAPAIPKTMTTTDLETVFDAIAESVDKVAEEKQLLFLAKLSFTLANVVGDADRVRAAIEACLADL